VSRFRVTRTCLCLIVLLMTVSCSTRIMTVSGELPHGTIHWSGRVNILGDVLIPRETHIVIEPGTDVVFLPPGDKDFLQEHPNFVGSELIVRGSLVAEGTPEKPIQFRYVDPDGPVGSWGGVNLMEVPEARFAFCIFTQSDSALHSQESKVFIEESIFENNKVGIRFHSSEILIEHNLIRNNGAGIRFHFGAPVICNNRLENNAKGLFITSEPRDYHIRNNLFVDNRPYHVVLGEAVVDDVDLKNNSWSDIESDNFADSLFDNARDPVLGKVLINPAKSNIESHAGVSWSL